MNKKIFVALGCASLLVCGCGKKVEENIPENNNVNESSNVKELITIVSGNKYDVYSHMNFDGFEYKNEDITVDYSYPVINIENEEINKVNESIRDTFEQSESKLRNLNEVNGCVCVKIDDTFHCGGEHLETLEYHLYETSDYLTVQITKVGRTYCASGYSDNVLYTISKNTQKQLDYNNIFDLYNIDKEALDSKIKQTYLDENGIELSNTDIIKYGIYDDKSILIIIPSGSRELTYSYDGTTLTKNS